MPKVAGQPISMAPESIAIEIIVGQTDEQSLSHASVAGKLVVAKDARAIHQAIEKYSLKKLANSLVLNSRKGWR